MAIVCSFKWHLIRNGKVAIWTVKRKVLDGGKEPFWKKRRHEVHAKAFANVPSSPRIAPSLPIEIWRKIVGYTVRIAGSRSVDLEDPFSKPYQDEEWPEIEQGIFEDRRSLAQVSSTLRALVTEVFAEYLVIHRGEDLDHVVRLFKRSKPNSAGKRLGDKTLRIDLKIIGPYNVKQIAVLLQQTPNLLVFVTQNNRGKGVLGRVPADLIKALIKYGRNIRRLDFDSINEAPALFDLIDISRHLQRLDTFRLLCIHSYSLSPETVRHLPIAHFKSVKTLSLGTIPTPANGEIPDGYVLVWDPFLHYLGLNVKQLPLLERFETAILPSHTMQFFHTQGPKLRMLRTTTWSEEGCLPEVLASCTNLESLVLVHSSQVPIFPLRHPTIKKICITPFVEEIVNVPPRVFRYAVLDPLDDLMKAIEHTTFPRLTEVRIRNVGAFASLVEHAAFLQTWWRRWNLRGILFVDQDGQSCDNITDPNENLLNQIRE